MDTLRQFLGVQATDGMFDHDDMGIDLARLSLGLHQGQECIGGQDKVGNATFFKFDAVMETPRRTCPSIRYGEKGRPVLAGQFVIHALGRRLGRAVLVDAQP